MAPLAEVISSLYGAMRLARFAPDGLDAMNLKASGFFRSFTAALVVLPFFLVLLLGRYLTDDDPPNFFRYIILENITYVIAWCVFPLVMEGITRSIGAGRNYVRFIIAYNWSMAPQNALYTIVILMGFLGVFSDGVTNGLAMMVLVWSMVFTGFVARITLDVPTHVAAGVVVVDFLLSLCIRISISSQI